MEIHSLKPNCRWLSGPKFLLQPEDQWPVRKIGNIPDDDKEIRVGSHVTLISLGSALDLFLRRYSSWPRLQTLMDRHRRAAKLNAENCPVGSAPALP